MSLLEQAKEYTRLGRNRVEITDEILELVLAYLRGDVNLSQLRYVLTKDSRGSLQVYVTAFRAVTKLRDQGRLKII